MKKVLFATTALVASTSWAYADVTLSGFAEMGVAGGDPIETEFHQDIDLTFTMSGETDNGLTFGASIDIDSTETPNNQTFTGTSFEGTPGTRDGSGGDVVIFISSDYGTLTMGDTDGAFDFAMTEVGSGAGTLQDEHTIHAGYDANSGLDGIYDGQVARYAYTFGDFTVAGSAELNDAKESVAGSNLSDGDTAYGLGATYSTSFSGVDLGFGLGYQAADDAYVNPFGFGNGAGVGGADVATNSDVQIIGGSVDATFGNGFRAVVNYNTRDYDGGTNEYDGDVDFYGIGLSYTMDALTLHMNYGKYDADLDQGSYSYDEDSDGYALAVNYDLGGGLEAQLGYTNDVSKFDDDDDELYSAGVAMSF